MPTQKERWSNTKANCNCANALTSFGEWPFDFVRASLLVPQQEIRRLKNKMIPIDTELIYRST
jgi:hypothetical protein